MHQPVILYNDIMGEKRRAILSKEAIEDRIITYEYYLMVRLLNKMLEEEEAKLAKKIGLTLPQYTVLIIAYYNEGLKVSEIARIGSWHISTVMSLLDTLVERKLVRMEPVARGRGYHVFLTDTGNELREKAFDFDLPRLKKFLGVVGSDGLHTNLQNIYRILSQVYGQENIAEIREHINKSKEKISSVHVVD